MFKNGGMDEVSELRRDMAARIKECRVAQKATQQDIADLLGIVRPAYGKKESGEVWFNAFELAKLSSHFNRSLDWIVNGKENGHPSDNLTTEEWQLVRLFRRASREGKHDIRECAVEALLED